MRHLFLIGQLDDESLAPKVRRAIGRYLESREDVTIQATVLIKGTRIHVVGIPEHIAEDLGTWYSEKQREGFSD